MNNTTVDALKDVYTELGGSAATVASMQTDAEVIEALSALVGSTIELPAVTSEDNGDVLTVVEGAWAKAEPATPPSELPTVTSDDNGKLLAVVNGEWDKAEASGGVEIFNVTISGSNVTLDNNKTKGDIKNAITSGKSVMLLSNDNFYFVLTRNSETEITFGRTAPTSIAAIVFAGSDTSTTGTYILNMFTPTT